MNFYYSRYHIPRFLPLKWGLLLREATGIPPVYSQTSREKKLIFIHIPKAAGSSVGELLLGTDRIGHYPFEIYKKYNPSWFQNFYKISVCRHPFDRFVSAFDYLKTGGKGRADGVLGAYLSSFEGGINEFVLNGFDQEFALKNAHFYPQHKFIFDDAEQLMVNKLCRLESLECDFEEVSMRFSAGKSLQYTNKRKKNIASSLSDSAMDKLYGVYRKDFELLKYEK